MNQDMMNMLAGQQTHALKKYIFDMIPEKYHEHDEILTRSTANLVTQKDIEEFAKFVAVVFESGYLKAAEQYKENMENLGYKLDVVAPEEKKDVPSIF